MAANRRLAKHPDVPAAEEEPAGERPDESGGKDE
jgi:hypothetical protein